MTSYIRSLQLSKSCKSCRPSYVVTPGSSRAPCYAYFDNKEVSFDDWIHVQSVCTYPMKCKDSLKWQFT